VSKPFEDDGLWDRELSDIGDEPGFQPEPCPECGADLETHITGDIRLVAGEIWDDTREVTECPACGWAKEDAEEEF